MGRRSLLSCVFLCLFIRACIASQVDEMNDHRRAVCKLGIDSSSGGDLTVLDEAALPDLTDMDGIRRWRAKHLPPLPSARCNGTDNNFPLGRMLPHQLAYIHVMKTGGLYLDKIINWNCENLIEYGCYVSHHEGHAIFVPKNHLPDEREGSFCMNNAPVLTTHGAARRIVGPNARCFHRGFEHTSVITILREPVSRLYSLYKYAGKSEHSSHRYKSLLQVLQETQADAPLELGDCEFCRKWQWVNSMVNQLSTADWKDEMGVETSMETHLESAKANLAFRMTVVGLTERMDDTITLLQHKLPIWFDGNVRPEEPVNAGRSIPEGLEELWKLNDTTRAKLVEMNEYDIELYDWAADLFEMEMENLKAVVE